MTVLYLCICWINLLCEGYSLFLRADHARDCHVLSKLQFSNALKTFFKVRLHTQGVFGLGQDLQQLIIGEEKEPNDTKTVKRKRNISKALLHIMFT